MKSGHEGPLIRFSIRNLCTNICEMCSSDTEVSLGSGEAGLGLNPVENRRNAYRNDDTLLGEQPRLSG